MAMKHLVYVHKWVRGSTPHLYPCLYPRYELCCQKLTMGEIEFYTAFLISCYVDLRLPCEALAILKFCCMSVVLTCIFGISPLDNSCWFVGKQGPHVGFLWMLGEHRFKGVWVSLKVMVLSHIRWHTYLSAMSYNWAWKVTGSWGSFHIYVQVPCCWYCDWQWGFMGLGFMRVF